MNKQILNKLHYLWIRPLLVGFLIWLLAILVAAPSLNVVLNHGSDHNRFRDTFSNQVIDPFYRPGTDHQGWEGGFMAYRIAVPMVAHGLGLGPWGGVALIWLSGLLAIAVIYRGLVSKGVEASSAFWLVLGLGATSPLLQGSHVYVGYPDALGWLLVAVLMWTKQPGVWALLTFVGLFNDERILIALPLALAVMLFDERRNLRSLILQGLPYGIAVSLGVSMALVARYGIKTGFIGHAPILGNELPHDILPWSLNRFHAAGLLISFGLLWVLPILAMLHDRQARLFWMLIFIYCSIVVYMIAYAADFWRGLASIYPLFVLSILALTQKNLPSDWSIRKLLPMLVILMMIIPQLEQMGDKIRWLRPLPISVLEWYKGESFLVMVGLRG